MQASKEKQKLKTLQADDKASVESLAAELAGLTDDPRPVNQILLDKASSTEKTLQADEKARIK